MSSNSPSTIRKPDDRTDAMRRYNAAVKRAEVALMLRRVHGIESVSDTGVFVIDNSVPPRYAVPAPIKEG